MRSKTSLLFLATSLLLGGSVMGLAQGIGGGETKTPNSPPVTSSDPAIRNPNSPAASNRGDPGTEPIDPRSGGPTLGQGGGSGAVGQGSPPARPSTPGSMQLPDSSNPNGR